MGTVPPTERTLYQVLGVRPNASTVEIRRAHRQLAYLLHPDRQGESTAAERVLAERRMREVNAAWTTLSDPQRRTDYDRSIAGSPAGPSAPSAGSQTPGSTDVGPVEPGDGGGPVPWWDSDDPDAAFARAKAAEAEDLDGDMSPSGFWFLRRGPVVLMLAVGLVIFIGTAYAGRGASEPSATTVAPAVVAHSDCLKFMQQHMAYSVSCDSNYDARVVREEPTAQRCVTDGLDYAVIGATSFCVKAR